MAKSRLEILSKAEIWLETETGIGNEKEIVIGTRKGKKAKTRRRRRRI